MSSSTNTDATFPCVQCDFTIDNDKLRNRTKKWETLDFQKKVLSHTGLCQALRVNLLLDSLRCVVLQHLSGTKYFQPTPF